MERRLAEATTSCKHRSEIALLSREASPVQEGQSVILSCGLGADSTALLFKYLAETNEERGFQLEELVVITALVGREWDETIDKMQRFILPLLRQYDVLTTQ